MSQFFVRNYNGEPFQLFGLPHIIALTIAAIAISSLYYLRYLSDYRLNLKFRYTLAAILIINELGWHCWNYFTGQWTIRKMLPFHMCTVMVWLSAILLITQNCTIYEFVYFLGIGGASQTILTPDVGQYGFPHYRFFHIFISHGSIILAALFMTIVEKYRPFGKSLVKIILGANAYMILIYFVNVLVGSNYMFTVHKPETPSLLDLLGPWPWYILCAEAIGCVVFMLLYLPFAIGDWRKKTKLCLLSDQGRQTMK